MALHFNSENHRRFDIKFLSCLLIQLPGWGGGETHVASNLGREGGASYWGGL